jgi:hypothetical protein
MEGKKMISFCNSVIDKHALKGYSFVVNIITVSELYGKRLGPKRYVIEIKTHTEDILYIGLEGSYKNEWEMEKSSHLCKNTCFFATGLMDLVEANTISVCLRTLRNHFFKQKNAIFPQVEFSDGFEVFKSWVDERPSVTGRSKESFFQSRDFYRSLRFYS